MSDTEFATLKYAPRGFTWPLLLGGLAVAAALAIHAVPNLKKEDAAPKSPTLARLAKPSAPAAPSVFYKEAGMTPSQLLNRWDTHVAEAARRFKVPRTWIRAVMARESGGRTMLGEGLPIVSTAGAMGLMQVMPQTYAEMRAEHGLGADPFDARDNILAGTAYLRWLHARYGYPRMFAAYNAGPGRLEDHMVRGSVLPAETRAYVGGITRVLNPNLASNDMDIVKLTRPDGQAILIEAGKVTGVRAAAPGEFAPGVQTVVMLGKRPQGVLENVIVATTAIRATGGLL